MFSIMVNEKGGEQKRLEFDKTEVTIGRVQGNDIVLPKGNVSKRHSRIVLKDGKYIIVDLKSTNGTYVNGRKITSPLVVKGTDKIYIGDFILNIEDATGAEAGDETTAPPAPRKTATIPPPPPRRGTPSRPEFEAAETAGAAEIDANNEPEEESTPLPEPAVAPVAPARSSSPSLNAVGAASSPSVRPVRDTSPPAVAQSPARPAPHAAPAAREQPVSSHGVARPVARPTVQPTAQPQVARRPSQVNVRKPAAAVVGDERNSVTAAMRELATRVWSQVGAAVESGPGAGGEDQLWSRVEHAARQLIGQIAVPQGTTEHDLIRDIVAETVSVGPLDDLLSDESVREIAVVRFDRIFVDRGGARELAPRWFSSPEAAMRALERLFARAGRSSVLSETNGTRKEAGLIQARIDGGLLVTAALPPLAARGPSLTIRRPRRTGARVTDLVNDATLSQGMADFLEAAVKARRNILVCGSSGSGRSTVLGALARLGEGERIVSIEEAEELDLGDGPWIQLLAHGDRARDAIGAALRLRPDRLVVGDVRGAEALALISALAGGTEGALCAVQSGSPRDAVARLEAMARLAPDAPSSQALYEEIARGIQLVVHVVRGADGNPRVGEIADVSIDENTLGPVLHTVFSFKPDAAGGFFAASGHLPQWAEGGRVSSFHA